MTALKRLKKDLQAPKGEGYEPLRKYRTNHKEFKGKIFSYISLY